MQIPGLLAYHRANPKDEHKSKLSIREDSEKKKIVELERKLREVTVRSQRAEQHAEDALDRLRQEQLLFDAEREGVSKEKMATQGKILELEHDVRMAKEDSSRKDAAYIREKQRRDREVEAQRMPSLLREEYKHMRREPDNKGS